MPRINNNPNQLELFEDMIKRTELPIDAKNSPETRPVPPLIITAIQDICKQLDRLNIGSQSSSEFPSDGH